MNTALECDVRSRWVCCDNPPSSRSADAALSTFVLWAFSELILRLLDQTWSLTTSGCCRQHCLPRCSSRLRRSRRTTTLSSFLSDPWQSWLTGSTRTETTNERSSSAWSYGRETRRTLAFCSLFLPSTFSVVNWTSKSDFPHVQT